MPKSPLVPLSLRASRLSACVLLLASAFAAAQTPPATPPDLAGVWANQSRFGASARGELTLDGRGGSWRASLAGYQVPVTFSKGDLSFTLPGDAGEFRGHLNAAARTLNGQWIQPAGDILNNQYSSPVHLALVSPSVWRGSVAPLDQAISLYVSIQSGKDGKLSAIIANPEMNFFRRRIYAVTQQGSKVHLAGPKPQQNIDGEFDADSGTLSLQVVGFLPPFRFVRTPGESAVGFYPRASSGHAAYEYREPVAAADGWQTASLSQAGFDEQPIDALVKAILASNPADNKLDIHSLLIARRGHLVLEEYFYGFDRDQVHDMRSASKTFAPLLAGLAREHGTKLDPATPVYPLFSRYKTFANPDPRKARVTLVDLMTMTAGNACDDNNDDSPGNEDNMQQSKQHDWYKYTLDLPMLSEPGGDHAIYCSADQNLVGGAVAAATGKWLPDLFDQYIARPLNFGPYYLNLMPDGQAYMGGGARLRPRDELKLGQLYLNGGLWNGQRIISSDWVKQSLTPHAAFDPAFSLGQEHRYGYGWHINYLKSGGKTYTAYSAGGNGGQMVIVLPALDVVIGFNGGSYGEFDKWYRWELELVPQYIIPAVVKNAGH